MPGFARVATALAAAVVLHAAPHRLRVYPNPGLRAFAIASGPRGFLWLAAADGLYRFDGFHFQKINGFPMASARFLAFTSDGSLWAADFQGLVRMRAGRFETILRGDITGLTAGPDEVFAQAGKDFVRIGIDGSIRRLGYRMRNDFIIDSTGRIWGVCLSPIEACWMDRKNLEDRHSAGDAYEFHGAFPDASGRVWLEDAEHAVLLQDGRPGLQLERRATTEGNRAGALLLGREGRLWFLGESPREVVSGDEFRDRTDHNRFVPLAGFEDSAKHLWISSLDQGLVEWIPDPNWDRWFPEDFSGEASALILRDARGATIAATHKHIYRKEGGHWKRLTQQERRYDSLIALDGGGFLASIRDFGVAVLSDDGRLLERLPDLHRGRNQYRKILRDAKGRYWVGSKEALLRVEGERGSYHFRRALLPEMGESDLHQAVDLEVDKTGRLWAGYVRGVAWLDENDTWHRIETSEPVTEIRSIAVDADRIWLSYRVPGRFSRLTKNGDRWDVTTYAYPPRDTYFVKRDSRGWIWRGGPNGIYVADGHNFGPDDWLHIDMRNGLAANELDEYGFFEDSDGSIWIAGEEGVTHLRPESSWFGTPRNAQPQVTRVIADGQTFDLSSGIPAEFGSDLKVIQIDVGTMAASPFRDDPLRWRLTPSGQWQALANGSVELRNLARGQHSLELAYAGGEASVVFAFRVGPVLQWTWWIWLAPAGLAAPFALRKRAWAKARFRLEKMIFLLRRRFEHTAADSVLNDWSGEILNDRYRAHRIVSRGGFSMVYEAADLLDPGSRVAVKVLSRTTRKDSWMRDRFAHEVSALRSLDHPGVVPILDSWISPLGEPCLAMPFLAGDTLRHRMRGFDRRRAAKVVRRMGDALGVVHARGIVHRDLKPENIILLGDDQPVIVDFGSAGLRSAEDELAETTLIAGSFHYMAPERLTGRYSPATDVYSLAVIVLELLSGKRLADLHAAFSDESFGDELSEALGGELAAIVMPAFDPDPRRRPGPVEEWTDRVASAMERES